MPDKTTTESYRAKAASDTRHQAGRPRIDDSHVPPGSSEPLKCFRVLCGTCQHKWVALYTPMPLFKSARGLGSLHCPRCAQDASNIFCWEADAG